MKAGLHLFASLDVIRRVCKRVSECFNFSNTIQKHPLAGSECDYWRRATQPFPSPWSWETPLEVLTGGWQGMVCGWMCEDKRQSTITVSCQLLKLVLLN